MDRRKAFSRKDRWYELEAERRNCLSGGGNDVKQGMPRKTSVGRVDSAVRARLRFMGVSTLLHVQRDDVAMNCPPNRRGRYRYLRCPQIGCGSDGDER